MAAAGSRAAPVAVVGDLEVERLACVAEDDSSRRRPRVLERVRERFLDDPVRGEIEPGAERFRRAVDVDLDREPGAAVVLDERAEVRQGRALGGVRLDRSEQPAHLCERLPPGTGNRAQRLDRAAGLSLEREPRRAGLDRHHADRVRDHVVQLAGDSQALGRPCGAVSLLALALQLRRALAQLERLVLAPPQCLADEPRTDADDGDERSGGASRLDLDREDLDADEADSEADERACPIVVAAEEVGPERGRGDGDGELPDRLGGEERGDADDERRHDGREQRKPATEDERQRHRRRQ